jgi:hypothetical protein
VLFSFASISLRNLCEDPDRTGRDLPAAVLQTLKDRVADLWAATCWADLQFIGPELDTRSPGRLRWPLGEGYELVCSGGDPDHRLLADGSIDMQRLRRVKIEHVGKAD